MKKTKLKKFSRRNLQKPGYRTPSRIFNQRAYLGKKVYTAKGRQAK